MYRAAGYEWGAPRDVDLAGAVEAFASLPLLFQPGSEWNYSVATDVLGRLVEVLAKAPLDEALREMIFEPLGMHDTFFRLPDDRRDRLAALYLARPRGGIARNDPAGEAVVAPSWFSGGGGLSSTVEDYHRFTMFLRGRGELDGTRLLGDRTVGYMTRNHLPGGADLRAFGRPLFAESPLDGVGFGLGFAVNLDPVATHTLGSVGEFNWGGAASTAFWGRPRRGPHLRVHDAAAALEHVPAALTVAPAGLRLARRLLSCYRFEEPEHCEAVTTQEGRARAASCAATSAGRS